MRVLTLLLLILLSRPIDLSAQVNDWQSQLLELAYQTKTAKDDSQIEEICQRRLHLLDSVYTHYNKRNYNDEWYPDICLSLIRLYILFEDGQSANKILTNALKQIKDKEYTLAFKVEQIRILILNGDIGGGETLFQEIGPQINDILQQYYKEPYTLQLCNIILTYYNAQQMLLRHYLHAIKKFQETQQYERGQIFLKSKEDLFTQSVFTFDVLQKIRHTAQTYGLSTDLSISEITNAKVFYYNHLGTFCAKMGLYVNASNFYYAAESYCDVEDLNSRFFIADTYLMIARQLAQLGNYMRADEYYAKCISITADSDNKDLRNTMCYAAMELATVKARCGQFNESRDYITMLINYYRSKHLIETADFIKLLWHTVSIVQLEEDYDECYNICQQALEILPLVENIDQNKYRAYFCNQLAYALSRLHKYEEALNCIGSIPQEYYTSNTYYTRASIQCKMGAYKDAILSLKECLCCQAKDEPHDNRLQVYSALLVTAIEADEQINVHELADPFMVLFKEISGISTYSDRAYLLPIYQIYYEIFLCYCRHFNVDIDVAYNLALCFKGAILQTTVDMRNRILSSNDKDLIDKYNQIEQIERQRTHTTENDELEQIESQIYDIEKEIIYKLDKKVDNTSNSYWITVKDALDENDASIEFVDYMYSTTSFEYAALILRKEKDWDAPKMIPLCKKSDLEPLITRLQGIYNSRTHRDSAESYIYKRLYTLIWSKLEPYIHEGDNVYFSPSGLLHQLNIEVLQDKTGRLANEKWNLHRVSSTRELCVDKPAVKWESAALYGGLVYDMDSTVMLAQSRAYRIDSNQEASRGFVADSTARGSWTQLPNTVREINAIDGLLREKRIKSAKYMQYVGTEESFKALSGKRTSIIHLATHGFFYKDEETKFKPFFESFNMDQFKYRPDNSLKRSGLILAGGQRAWLGQPIPDRVEDGILLAEEIAAMDLSGTDLVVLSACETGLGEITSEGVFGLQRAFKKAGVQTLVMSLWKVDDAATSLMMRTFYEHLLSGKSKHEAFAIAQQAVRNKYEHPYYWASFIMLD